MEKTDKQMKELFEETKANLVILQRQKMGVYYTKLLPTIIRNWKERLEIERENMIALFEFNFLYRMRGTELDMETQSTDKDFFRGMNDAYSSLWRKCGDIKYLISAVNEKYLNEEELLIWRRLKDALEVNEDDR